MRKVNQNLKFIVSLLSVFWAAFQTANPGGSKWATPVCAGIASVLVWLVPNEPAVIKEIEQVIEKGMGRIRPASPNAGAGGSGAPAVRVTQPNVTQASAGTNKPTDLGPGGSW